jgi:hypothetical protein
MSAQRITIQLSQGLEARLRSRALAEGQTLSEIIRTALQNYLGNKPSPRSAYEAAKELGLIGCLRGLPKDLSTNPRYMRGFGKDKRMRVLINKVKQPNRPHCPELDRLR